MRNSTEIFFTILLASVFFLLLIGIIVFVLWRNYARKRAHELALIAFEQTLLQSRLEIQEQTFITISQEIHDNVGQLLTLARLNLNTLEMPGDNHTKEKITDASSLISQSIQSLRDLTKTLHGDLISKHGLVEALAAEVKMMNKIGIVRCEFDVVGEETTVAADKSLIIFRIAQEALHNVVKHAQANNVWMTIQFQPQDIILSVSDDGLGLSSRTASTNGNGLRNMRDRSRIIGANLDIFSNKPSGTVVKLTIRQ